MSEWGPNLSERFPWLADGAVINGWQHIHAGREHRGDPDQHFDKARRQLIQAATRGVPVYTEGLRLLVDGLRLLREDAEAEDAELDAALTFIEPFAIAADWSAATVTYSGEDPAKPDPRRRYGIPRNREGLEPLQVSKVAVYTEPPAAVAAAAERRPVAAVHNRPVPAWLSRARDLADELSRTLRKLADRDLPSGQGYLVDLARAQYLADNLAAAVARAAPAAEPEWRAAAMWKPAIWPATCAISWAVISSAIRPLTFSISPKSPTSCPPCSPLPSGAPKDVPVTMDR